MTGLFDPEKDLLVTAPTSRPIVTIGLSAASIIGLVTLLLKLGLFPSIGATSTVTHDELKNELDVHHRETQQKASEQIEVLKRIERLEQIDCIHHSKTDVERDQCVGVR